MIDMDISQMSLYIYLFFYMKDKINIRSINADKFILLEWKYRYGSVI